MRLTEEYFKNWKEMFYALAMFPLEAGPVWRILLAYVLALLILIPACILCLLGLEPDD